MMLYCCGLLPVLTMARKWTTNETSPNAKSNTMKPAPNVPMSAHPPYEPIRRMSTASEHVPHSLCMFYQIRFNLET